MQVVKIAPAEQAKTDECSQVANNEENPVEKAWNQVQVEDLHHLEDGEDDNSKDKGEEGESCSVHFVSVQAGGNDADENQVLNQVESEKTWEYGEKTQKESVQL